MDLTPIAGGGASSSFHSSPAAASAQNAGLREAVTASRQLNDLGIADREFSVIRDPDSHRFVVVVMERSTGNILDQFPAENILRMMTQLAASKPAQQDDHTTAAWA